VPLAPIARRGGADLDVPSGDRGGWVEVDYGEDGNVLAMTVHAACTDAPAETCDDEGGNTPGLHAASLRSDCVCAQEQHYVYRWDEVNRIAEASASSAPLAVGPGRSWCGSATFTTPRMRGP